MDESKSRLLKVLGPVTLFVVIWSKMTMVRLSMINACGAGIRMFLHKLVYYDDFE